MSPLDMTAKITASKQETTDRKAVILFHDEEIVLRSSRRGTGYHMLLPVPLCDHRHRSPEAAVICGHKAAIKLAARYDIDLTAPPEEDLDGA